MTEATGRLDGTEKPEDLDAEIGALEVEPERLDQEEREVRYLLRELMVREGYEPEKVAAEGNKVALTSRLAAIGREEDANETTLLELRIKRLMRDSEPWRTEHQAARDNQRRIREEQKRLEQEDEEALNRFNVACWNLNRYEDRIRDLWRELRQRPGGGGKL